MVIRHHDLARTERIREADSRRCYRHERRRETERSVPSTCSASILTEENPPPSHTAAKVRCCYVALARAACCRYRGCTPPMENGSFVRCRSWFRPHVVVDERERRTRRWSKVVAWLRWCRTMPGMGKNVAATSSLGEKTPLPSSAIDRARPLPPPLLLCLDGKRNRGGPMVEEETPPSSCQATPNPTLPPPTCLVRRLDTFPSLPGIVPHRKKERRAPARPVEHPSEPEVQSVGQASHPSFLDPILREIELTSVGRWTERNQRRWAREGDRAPNVRTAALGARALYGCPQSESRRYGWGCVYKKKANSINEEVSFRHQSINYLHQKNWLWPASGNFCREFLGSSFVQPDFIKSTRRRKSFSASRRPWINLVWRRIVVSSKLWFCFPFL
nr:NADH dehydrogenase subunit 4 [Ipomoea batatas]